MILHSIKREVTVPITDAMHQAMTGLSRDIRKYTTYGVQPDGTLWVAETEDDNGGPYPDPFTLWSSILRPDEDTSYQYWWLQGVGLERIPLEQFYLNNLPEQFNSMNYTPLNTGPRRWYFE